MANESLVEVEYTSIDSGVSKATGRIVTETPLSIVVNKKPLATALIMPVMTREFVAGHLYAQGIIRAARDIESMTITGDTAEVTLNCEKSGVKRPSVVKSNLKISAGEIFRGVREILKSDIFAETEAVHSAGLFRRGGETICVAEDLGRHNALDKVIGYGLLHDVDFSRTFATSTGRLPSEMLFKCLYVGIPLIATKGVPTNLAIEIAREAGITIAGLVRGSTMIIYSNPGRLER